MKLEQRRFATSEIDRSIQMMHVYACLYAGCIQLSTNYAPDVAMPFEQTKDANARTRGGGAGACLGGFGGGKGYGKSLLGSPGGPVQVE